MLCAAHDAYNTELLNPVKRCTWYESQQDANHISFRNAHYFFLAGGAAAMLASRRVTVSNKATSL